MSKCQVNSNEKWRYKLNSDAVSCFKMWAILTLLQVGLLQSIPPPPSCGQLVRPFVARGVNPADIPQTPLSGEDTWWWLQSIGTSLGTQRVVWPKVNVLILNLNLTLDDLRLGLFLSINNLFSARCHNMWSARNYHHKNPYRVSYASHASIQ